MPATHPRPARPGADRRSARSRLAELRGPTLTAATVLAIALVISIAGSAVTYMRVDQAYRQQNAVADAKGRLDTILRAQLDEENALRGYLASGQKVYLGPYYTSRPVFSENLTALQSDLQRAGLSESYPLLDDLQRSHGLWETQVARPLLAHPTAPGEIVLLQRGKVIVDRVRSDYHALGDLLQRQSGVAADMMRALLLRAALLTSALILVFGAAAIIADMVRSRTQLSLERERVIGETLQRAFLSGWDTCPFLEVGTAYVSAAMHVAIGGDLFDVYRLDDHRALLVVADISGKGLDAAVDTAFVKYSLRSLAVDYDDPSLILRKFNLAFLKSVRDEASFVSLFTGILDARSGILHYASAGHSPVFVRRGSDLRQIPVTGPLIGLRPDDTFAASTEQLQPGDILVLATDGLTEARDTAGVMLDESGAMRILRQAPAQPQAMADFVVAQVNRTSGGRIADDLALLVVTFLGTPEAAAPAAGVAERTFAR